MSDNGATVDVDFRIWDWLPDAANEIESYLERLLTEAAVTAHDVSARAKSITSFQDKCSRKGYEDPLRDVTDAVAVRIITYSVTDRERASELVADRFACAENTNPGKTKPPPQRGYDCQHLVITGEKPSADPGWLIAGGKLSRYFATFSGLEIQIRTVAAHAWAEFEHARRYKGQPYQAISDDDRGTIDQLFGAASDARSALDETFVAIDRVLANPRSSNSSPTRSDELTHDETGDEGLPADEGGRDSFTAVDPASLRNYLADRFPDDEEASENGMRFACELVDACRLSTIEDLARALDTIDGDQVRRLMDTTTSVTKVRRLDDELLARFGEVYIQNTGTLGNVGKRSQQLEWRYDRLRDKVLILGYKAYTLAGSDCPKALQDVLLPAARAVREVARVVADREGSDAALVEGAVSKSGNDLSPSTRAKEVALASGQSLWVTTNLSRQYSEELMAQILGRAEDLDLKVMRNGREIA